MKKLNQMKHLISMLLIFFSNPSNRILLRLNAFDCTNRQSVQETRAEKSFKVFCIIQEKTNSNNNCNDEFSQAAELSLSISMLVDHKTYIKYIKKAEFAG